MGSAVARRIRERGADVLTLLDGRSAATQARAEAAGMRATDLAGIAAADMILSIVPPADAIGLAQSLVPTLLQSARKPIYVDCNAIDVDTAKTIEGVIAAAGAPFVDAGIIGLPPKSGAVGPTIYLSGAEAQRASLFLAPLGLKVQAMDGPVGAASALKMSYAGITKGLAAIASIMILGAERAGAGPALRAELASSQPQLLARFGSSLPDMLPKAYRWIAEMREIAAFLRDDPAGAAVFQGIAQFYERISADTAGERTEARRIEAFVAPPDR
jgi:3-hydroxyisobutyrate dehydrogenase-like beta-hydroxyacid dehydrogenase